MAFKAGCHLFSLSTNCKERGWWGADEGDCGCCAEAGGGGCRGRGCGGGPVEQVDEPALPAATRIGRALEKIAICISRS